MGAVAQQEIDREKRRRWVYGIAIAVALLAAGAMVVLLRSLIVPTIIGALLAYICRPLVEKLMQRGVPRGVAILMLFSGIGAGVFFTVAEIRSSIPDERDELELRVRIEYQLRRRYDQVMGLPKGNVIYTVVGEELQPMFDQVMTALTLKAAEERKFRKYMAAAQSEDASDSEAENATTADMAERFVSYLESNKNARWQDAATVDTDMPAQDTAHVENSPKLEPTDKSKKKSSFLKEIMAIISLWLVMPFVFLFLLTDDGSIRRWFIDNVPNRYFELALTIIDNVDTAIGKYLRGTAAQCSLVGLTFGVCLAVVGVEVQWAMLIGVAAGMANAIPFLGPVIGLVIGCGYALIVEDVDSILPFVTHENLVVFVLLTVGVAQLLDNAVFQPLVLGGAVNLHPLVVVLGVMAGSILFGFVGMLLAIPAIVVIRVVTVTFFRELTAYRII